MMNITNATKMDDEILIFVAAAARLLGRSTQSVRIYERNGRLPSMKTEDGTRLFKKSDVLKLARELNGDKPTFKLRRLNGQAAANR